MKNGAAGLLLVVAAVACGSSSATTANPSATLAAQATLSPTQSPQLVATPTASPSARATATANAASALPAIGDPCLVGRWTLTNLVISDSISFPGVTMSMTGQVGTVMTLGADGTEIFDLTNSTRLSGAGGGHTMSWLGRGVQRFGFHGEGGQWTESGPPQIATATNVIVDGVSQPDFSSEAPPFSGSYTCAGSDLTIAVDLPSYSQTATFKK